MSRPYISVQFTAWLLSPQHILSFVVAINLNRPHQIIARQHWAVVDWHLSSDE
jgi:hypothetical protein